MNIYVGNLSFRTDDEELREVFSEFGEVSSAKVVMDRETNRSRGFGFVEMPKAGEAKIAVKSLNNKTVGGNKIRVKKAQYQSR